jgi:hypothetical protein
MGEEEPNLVAVPRDGVVVEEHASCAPEPASSRGT